MIAPKQADTEQADSGHLHVRCMNTRKHRIYADLQIVGEDKGFVATPVDVVLPLGEPNSDGECRELFAESAVNPLSTVS